MTLPMATGGWENSKTCKQQKKEMGPLHTHWQLSTGYNKNIRRHRTKNIFWTHQQ